MTCGQPHRGLLVVPRVFLALGVHSLQNNNWTPMFGRPRRKESMALEAPAARQTNVEKGTQYSIYRQIERAFFDFHERVVLLASSGSAVVKTHTRGCCSLPTGRLSQKHGYDVWTFTSQILDHTETRSSSGVQQHRAAWEIEKRNTQQMNIIQNAHYCTRLKAGARPKPLRVRTTQALNTQSSYAWHDAT